MRAHALYLQGWWGLSEADLKEVLPNSANFPREEIWPPVVLFTMGAVAGPSSDDTSGAAVAAVVVVLVIAGLCYYKRERLNELGVVVKITEAFASTKDKVSSIVSRSYSTLHRPSGVNFEPGAIANPVYTGAEREENISGGDSSDNVTAACPVSDTGGMPIAPPRRRSIKMIPKIAEVRTDSCTDDSSANVPAIGAPASTPSCNPRETQGKLKLKAQKKSAPPPPREGEVTGITGSACQDKISPPPKPSRPPPKPERPPNRTSNGSEPLHAAPHVFASAHTPTELAPAYSGSDASVAARTRTPAVKPRKNGPQNPLNPFAAAAIALAAESQDDDYLQVAGENSAQVAAQAAPLPRPRPAAAPRRPQRSIAAVDAAFSTAFAALQQEE